MQVLKNSILLIFVTTFLSLGCDRENEAEGNDNPASETADTMPETTLSGKFVGDEECGICHSEIYRTYKQTGMGRSFYLPSEKNIIENYSGKNHVYDPKRNLHYEVFQKNGDFYQTEYRLDEAGKRNHELIRKIDYIVGSGNHNRTYLYSDNGFLHELPVTWYSEKQLWDLSPGYHDHNMRFSRPVVPECMNCHNSYAENLKYIDNKYEDIPLGIGCERCHGPGEEHVDFRSNVRFDKTRNLKTDSTIINPRHLAPQQQMDVCRQCHLQGEIRVLKEGKEETDFRPGMLLTDVKSVFIRDKLPTGDFRIASHGARFSLSACFTKSNGRLTCITCHNPHEPVQWLSNDHFNAQCLECHEAAKLSPSGEGVAHAAEDNCISCHMRQGATSDILHVNFTDHWIRKRIETLSKDEETDLFTANDSETLSLKSFFEEKDSAARTRLGIAYLEYFEAKNRDTRYLESALSYLRAGLRRTPQHITGLYSLGKALFHRGEYSEALNALKKVTQADSKHALAFFQIGRVYQKLELPAEAARAYEKSLAIQPDNPVALTNLGNCYSQLQQNDLALEQYLKAIDVQPGYSLAQNNLGDLYAYKLGDLDSATVHFEKALKLDPDFTDALHNLGNIYLNQKNPDAAEAYFERAINTNSRFAPAYGNLAIIAVQKGETEEAKSYLKKLLEIQPGDRQAQALLQELNTD